MPKLPTLPALKIPPGLQGVWQKARQTGPQALHGLQHHRETLMRTLLAITVAGGAMLGWGSLESRTLQGELPGYHKLATSWAQTIDAALAAQTKRLTPLAADARLTEGLTQPEGVASIPVRRAMYEFSYVNQIPSVFVWDNQTGQMGRTATSTPPSPGATSWLADPAEGNHAALFGLPEAPLLYIAEKIKGAGLDGTLAMAIEWSSIQSQLPPPPALPVRAQGATNQTALWVSSDDKMWKIPLPGGIPTMWQTEGLTTTRSGSHLSPQGIVFLTAPLKNIHGAVLFAIPKANVTGSRHRGPQLALAGTAALLIALLLWPLTAPWRQQLHHTVTTHSQNPQTKGFTKTLLDSLAPITSLTAPSLNELTGSSRPSPSSKSASLSSSSPATSSEAPRRVRAMHIPTQPAPKPSSSSSAPSSSRPHTTPAPTPSQPDPGNIALNAAPDAPLTKQQVEKALFENRLTLLYHPIYEAASGKVKMHEVYVRLLDERGEKIAPGRFFPVATQNNLLPTIDATVYRKVMAEHFPSNLAPETPLSLNLSGSTMDDLSYLQTLAHIKKDNILKNLVFEVKSEEILQKPNLMKFLKDCQTAGIRLAVDYFGGGAGMVEASARIGFNYIKMDCTRLMRDTIAKKELVVLCRAAHRHQIPVVLEKIETAEMEAFARRVGVTYLQGFLFSPPRDTLTTRPLSPRHMNQPEPTPENPADKPA